MTNNCSNVITLKQYGPTCWFNSILMAILYSDNSRKLLLKKSQLWNDKILIFKTIKYILENKFLRTSSVYKDYLYFEKIRPEYILDKLYSYDKKKFNFNPRKNKGYLPSLYIRKIYKLLGAKVLYLDLNGNNLYYSVYNNITTKFRDDNKLALVYKYVSIEKVIEKFDNPDIIIVNIENTNRRYPQHYSIPRTSHFYNIINIDNNLNNSIVINDKEYVQDSVLLPNWNIQSDVGHSIAGINCRGDRYVYNGWTRSTIDYHINDLKVADDDVKNTNLWIIQVLNKKIQYKNTKTGQYLDKLPVDGKIIGNNIQVPCELMKYEWNVNKNSDFCLNLSKCSLDLHSEKSIPAIINNKDKKLCFSFNKGKRQVIYVNKSNISVGEEKTIDKPCPDGKVRNPSTGRCINIKTIKL